MFQWDGKLAVMRTIGDRRDADETGAIGGFGHETVSCSLFPASKH